MKISTHHSQRAFTITDLVVLVAVVGFLGCTLLAALGNVREKAPRTQCANNLQQLWVAFQNLANPGGVSLPQDSTSVHGTAVPLDSHTGSSLWDISNANANLLLNAGARRPQFYCPTAPNSLADADYWWNYNGGTYKTTGYFWMFERGDTSHPFYPNFGSNGGGTPNPANNSRKLVRSLSSSPTTNFTIATTELIADITVSEGSGNRTTDKFLNITSITAGQIINSNLFTGFQTSHTLGTAPQGGNILFLDGHVAWRPFSQMNWVVGWSNSRYFWF